MKQVKSLYIAIGVGVLIVLLAVFFTYSADQARIRGESFGNNLQAIQDELKQIQGKFYSNKAILDEGGMTKEEFSSFAKTHIEKLELILQKYDTLRPPESFVPAVKLFKLSTQKQLESDKYLIEWIVNGDESARIRSDLLLQESFADEIAALTSYSKAKDRAGQN